MNIRFAPLAIALAATTGAIAADKETVLSNVHMPVMINQGSAYVEATDSMFLFAGDRVMILEGGSAQLNYANGCVQVLAANEVAQVSTPESCNSMAAAGTYQALGSTSTGGGGGGLSTTNMVIVGLAGVGATAAILSNADNNNGGGNQRPPASP